MSLLHGTTADDLKAEILDLLAEKQSLTTAEIRFAMNISKSHANRLMSVMRGIDCTIRQAPGRKGIEPFRWQVGAEPIPVSVLNDCSNPRRPRCTTWALNMRRDELVAALFGMPITAQVMA